MDQKLDQALILLTIIAKQKDQSRQNSEDLGDVS
jgi:hypothetical protein